MNFNIIPANEKHLQALPDLLAPTGFWRAGIEKNSLGLSYQEFAKNCILEPLLPYTFVAVPPEDTGKVYGFITCGRKDKLDAIPSHREYYHPKISHLFSPIAQLELPDGYIISFLSVDASMRGLNIGKGLFEHAESDANAEGCDTISLIVWAFNRDAIHFYLNRGMLVSGSVSFEAPISSTLLRMERNPSTSRQVNFFESEAYTKFYLI